MLLAGLPEGASAALGQLMLEVAGLAPDWPAFLGAVRAALAMETAWKLGEGEVRRRPHVGATGTCSAVAGHVRAGARGSGAHEARHPSSPPLPCPPRVQGQQHFERARQLLEWLLQQTEKQAGVIWPLPPAGCTARLLPSAPGAAPVTAASCALTAAREGQVRAQAQRILQALSDARRDGPGSKDALV